jgi:hypothetical protein
MEEGRKRVIGMMAAILASLHMQTADDLFETPQGSPRTDKLIAASIQWAERIMEKIDGSLSDEPARRVLSGLSHDASPGMKEHQEKAQPQKK